MKSEVLYIMAHLVITLVIVIGYIYTTITTGVSDETLKMALIAIIGYWFGALGNDKIQSLKKKKEGQ